MAGEPLCSHALPLDLLFRLSCRENVATSFRDFSEKISSHAFGQLIRAAVFLLCADLNPGWAPCLVFLAISMVVVFLLCLLGGG